MPITTDATGTGGPGGVAAHVSTHKAAGADPIRLDELKVPTDVTTLNATTSLHGLCPKLDGNVAHFLRGDGTWGT